MKQPKILEVNIAMELTKGFSGLLQFFQGREIFQYLMPDARFQLPTAIKHLL
ncbi:MAG: hypothetical protein OSA83_06865 [Pseudomonadales bacterium]|nr:hypothetical protein [Pseudomonadales bacterium]